MNALSHVTRFFFAATALASLSLFAVGCASETDTSEDGDSSEGAVSASEPFFCPTATNEEFSQPSASSASALLVAARAAGQPTLGVDRFVLEFANNGAAPAFTIVAQDSSTFAGTGEQTFKLLGTKGLGVHVHGASAGWPIDGDNTPVYNGTKDIKPGDTTKIKEARYIEDFEADLYWGVGLSATSCFRAYRLTNPPRLVVDVKR
jgi:hypothetical protein